MKTLETYVDTLQSVNSKMSEAILNSLKDRIYVIEESERICFVNEEWN